MKPSLKAKLADAINDFVVDNCEDVDWPDMYSHFDMVDHMTNAAEAVFDATFASSKFSKECYANEQP